MIHNSELHDQDFSGIIKDFEQGYILRPPRKKIIFGKNICPCNLLYPSLKFRFHNTKPSYLKNDYLKTGHIL